MKVKRLKDIVDYIEDMKNICCNFFVLRLVYDIENYIVYEIENYMFVNVNNIGKHVKDAYMTERKIKELLR